MSMGIDEYKLKTFKEAPISLPRYQRKKKWNDNQNFEFCISVFKGFPLGLVVLSSEKDDEGVPVTLLLDGRQRLNCITEMENPLNIYNWSKKYLGFGKKPKKGSKTGGSEVDEPDELNIIDLFEEKLEEFLEPEETDDENKVDVNSGTSDRSGETVNTADYSDESPQDELRQETVSDSDPTEEDNDESLASSESGEEHVKPISTKTGQAGVEEKGINTDVYLLRDLILICHPLSNGVPRFAKMLNFARYVDGLIYIDKKTGRINTDDLLNWIRMSKLYINGKYKADKKVSRSKFTKDIILNESMFYEILIQGSKGLKSKVREQTVKKAITARWAEISRVLNLLDILEFTLNNRTIGYVLLEDCEPRDAQKIFEIINTKGTPLTMAEILSAKPSWNNRIEGLSREMIRDIESLYDELDVGNAQDIKPVIWDVAATSIKRIKFEYIL